MHNSFFRVIPNSVFNLEVHKEFSKLDVQREHSESHKNAFTNPTKDNITHTHKHTIQKQTKKKKEEKLVFML